MECYSYVLAYVADILAIDHNPDAIMEQIWERFKFKNDAIVEPESYLGAKVQKRRLYEVEMWTMFSVGYAEAALNNVLQSSHSTQVSVYCDHTYHRFHGRIDLSEVSPGTDDDEP